jgi:hypothetical protein
MKAVRVAFAAGVLGIAIACGPGFLDGISGGVRPIDGGTSAEGGPTCNSRQAPPPPTGINDTGSVSALLAIQIVQIDTASDAGIAAPVSLDMDHTCTGAGQGDSCLRPGDGGVFKDGPRGEDNALGLLFNAINAAQNFPPTFATDRIKAGYFTLMIGLAGWNGLPDDPQVGIVLYDSEGITKKDADGGRALPKFDGTDVWSIDPDSVVSGADHIGVDCASPDAKYSCIARTRDDFAYVTGGKLVARPRRDSDSNGPVPVNLRSVVGDISMNFYDLTLIGDLKGGPDGATALNAEFSGRIPVSNLIQTFGGIQDFTKNNGQPLCNNPSLFSLSRGAVCAAQDLSDPGKDNTGQKCDYISGAFSFSAIPAVLGSIFQADGLDGGCNDTSLFVCP